MYILCCQECGKMYKATKYNNYYITDFGDKLDTCLICKGQLDVIQTEDWVADMVFRIKGK